MIIVALFKTVGKLFLLAAATAFLVCVSLLLIGSYLLTWPVLRKSPRQRKLQASMELASAVVTFMSAFGDNPALQQMIAERLPEE